MEWKKIDELELSFKPEEYRKDTLVGRYLVLVGSALPQVELTAQTSNLYCRMFESENKMPKYQKEFFGKDENGVIKKQKDGTVLVYFFGDVSFYNVRAYIPSEEMINEYKELIKE